MRANTSLKLACSHATAYCCPHDLLPTDMQCPFLQSATYRIIVLTAAYRCRITVPCVADLSPISQHLPKKASITLILKGGHTVTYNTTGHAWVLHGPEGCAVVSLNKQKHSSLEQHATQISMILNPATKLIHPRNMQGQRSPIVLGAGYVMKHVLTYPYSRKKEPYSCILIK